MLLIVSEQPTPRLSYLLNFIGSVWHVDVNFVDSKPQNDSQATLFYGKNIETEARLNLSNCHLLFEDNIHPISKGWNSQHQCLQYFCVDDKPDYLSAIFFHLSRYEEYLPTALDTFGRFDYKNSIAYKNNVLNLPLVEIYLDKLLYQIQTVYPSFKVTKNKSIFTPTMDIDVAFDYKGRSFLRTMGAYFKDLKAFNFANIWQRTLTLLNLKPDSAFVFEKLMHSNILFFIHVGQSRLLSGSKLDKSCGFKNKEYISFLQSLTPENIGLHPSFQSHLVKKEMALEKQKLSHLSKKSIHKSRQHYIKMILPESYELLSEIGITDDYSMGWPQIPGYRAGTVHSHYFFNLRLNKISNLKLHPFVWMDAHFLFNATNKKNDLDEQFHFYKQQAEQYGGNFTPIFHNNHFKHKSFGTLLYKLLATE